MPAFCHVVFAWVLNNRSPFVLQRNKIESQASTIRTLERCLWSFGPRKAGGSSDLVSDAADGVTPSPGDEGNPMNTTLQSKEGSSRHMKRLAPKHPSRRQVCEGTTLATIRSNLEIFLQVSRLPVMMRRRKTRRTQHLWYNVKAREVVYELL